MTGVPPRTDDSIADDPAPSWELIDRYIAGECDAAERTAVGQWSARAGASAQMLLRLPEAAGMRLSAEVSPGDTRQRSERILQSPRVDSRAERGRDPSRSLAEKSIPATQVRGAWVKGTLRRELGFGAGTSRETRPLGSFVLWAACVTLVLTVTFSLRSPIQRLLWQSDRTLHATTYRTHAGQYSRVALHDGTQIILAPQSHLTVPTDFARETRTVHLVGEALFKVRMAGRVPFVVRTGVVSTRVVGTQFSVRRYGTDDTVCVRVSAGKVVSSGRGAPVTVAAGMVAHMTDSTTVVTSLRELEQYVDWAHNELVFQRAPVPVVLATLERWYGYQFRLSDSVKARSAVSAVFKVSDPADMLIVLQGTLNVTMTFDGRVVTLTPRQDTKQSLHLPPRRDEVTSFTEIGK